MNLACLGIPVLTSRERSVITVHAQTHTNTHRQTHAHARAHTHTRSNTHTQPCSFTFPPCSLAPYELWDTIDATVTATHSILSSGACACCCSTLVPLHYSTKHPVITQRLGHKLGGSRRSDRNFRANGVGTLDDDAHFGRREISLHRRQQ